MEHGLPLISTLVIAFSLALIFGFVCERFLKSPALVGYLLAGIAAGQHTPGVFADPALAHQLSEIGVMLLMFGVGLHFSVKDLMSVKAIALPGAVLQMAIATVLGAVAVHFFWDWAWGQAFVFGASLSCASTVVLLKALEVRGILSTHDGRIAVGWLVVEDVATVLISCCCRLWPASSSGPTPRPRWPTTPRTPCPWATSRAKSSPRAPRRSPVRLRLRPGRRFRCCAKS